MARSRFVIALITKDNDYQQEQASAAEDAARVLDVDVQIEYADSDPITQSQQLLDVIHSPHASEYAGIIVEPAGGSLTQVARAAVRARLAWVMINREIDTIAVIRKLSDVPVFSVSSDHEEIGRIQAKQVRKLLPRGGQVLYLQGPPASRVAEQRANGLLEAKPANVSVTILKCPTWTEAGGQQAVTRWLREGALREQIDLVVGQNDLIAIGARNALMDHATSTHSLEFDDLRFTGVDGLPKTGQEWTKRGILAATVVVPPNTAPALQMLVQAARDHVQPPEQTLVTPYSFPELADLRAANEQYGSGLSGGRWKY
jgi:ABC-type sugar transport system substrate-binding protein